MNGRDDVLEKALAALDAICRKPTPPAPEVPLDDDLLADLRRPFVTWLDCTCTLNSRWSSGLICLHESFCAWCIRERIAPCDRDWFELLLCELGLKVGQVSGVTLVLGLVFKVDLESHEQFQRGDNNDYSPATAKPSKCVKGTRDFPLDFETKAEK
jgi:hypothetical protein